MKKMTKTMMRVLKKDLMKNKEKKMKKISI